MAKSQSKRKIHNIGRLRQTITLQREKQGWNHRCRGKVIYYVMHADKEINSGRRQAVVNL